MANKIDIKMQIDRNVVFKWLCWNNSKKAENNSAALCSCLLKNNLWNVTKEKLN